MFERVLKSGRKVKIRELSLDQIADLEDIPEVYFIGNQERTIKYRNTAILGWFRCGIGGGDFEGWKPNGVAPPDEVIRQLSEEEKLELLPMIQECQIVNPKKPSS